MDKEMLKLYFIMGSNNTGGRNPEQVLQEALQGGITCFQFREKGQGALPEEEKWRLGRKMKAQCAAFHVPFIVNDDVDMAIRLEADGIHIGQEDDPASKVKERCPSRMMVGVSVRTVEEAHRAAADGADYLGVGPMFATDTKEDAKAPVGLEGIRRLRAEGITLPIVGIGGIDASNAAAIVEAGADGVSLISAISLAEEPEKAARELRSRLGGSAKKQEK